MSTYNTKNYMEQGGEVLHIGGSLVIDSGATMTGGPQAANQADSTATTVAGIVSDFNTLLGTLKTAGLMAADSTD